VNTTSLRKVIIKILFFSVFALANQ